ncbi:MAG: cytochrome b/b6 domain-containing protein [Gemmatimonadaceae bacterium]|nr:cytochrome b/b6 domain-containing protein [Acetobacteraceae bacterium]
MSATASTGGGTSARRLHPVPIRIMHWVNAAAMIVMIGSGWGIYNDEVIFGWLFIPQPLRLGSWAAYSLQWHFAAMWVLVLNGLAYLIYGFATGRFRERLLPIRVPEIVHDVRQALRFHLAHEDLTIYNAVQKLLYVVVIAAGVMQVVTGLAIWKPIQFDYLTNLFGGFQGARLAHFIGMSVIFGFLVIHVVLAFLVPRTLVAMVTGGPTVERSSRR